MIGAGSYLLSAVLLAALLGSLALSAYRLRGRLLPSWDGAPARLVEAIAAVAILIWLAELLGTLQILYAWTLIVGAVLLAGGIAIWVRPSPLGDPSLPVGGADLGDHPADQPDRRGGGTKSVTGPAGPDGWSLLVMVGVIAVVVAHWGLTTDSALDRGMFNFDSLWYHMPLAADIAQSHSVTGVHHTETVFTTWFYPQNSELLHAAGILIAHRDTLSLFINFGWLAVAFLAAWVIGRPYGRGHLAVVAVAILLECHTLVVREPGAAKNDLATAAPLLAAIAILVSAWAARREDDGESLAPGWPLAAAGLAVGLAVGTKFTVFAMAGALSVAVIVLAPGGRRRAAAAWWFLPALAGGGFWYLRNLIVAGNPLPVIAHLGPITLPHPEGLEPLRPDFSIAHYAADTGVWSSYFAPGLHDQFGALWPMVIFGAVLAAILAVARGRDRIVRWTGAVALFGMVAYVFMPLSAAGPEGAPDAFAINVRYVVPAMLAALAILPLFHVFDDRRRQAGLMAALVVVLVLTNRSDAVLRDPSRLFGAGMAILLVLVPAALLALRGTGRIGNRGLAAGLAALAVAVAVIGYPVQRHYLGDRFANDGQQEEWLPGFGLDVTYPWAQGVSDSRIGLAGTTAGFLGYGFYGRDLSNRVLYLGEEGPHGAFTPIRDCRRFRAAVNAADLDYLVTSPFLNFEDPGRPVPSPEARWLRGAPQVRPLKRDGEVAVWKVEGALDPSACGPVNAPLSAVPHAPGA